VYTEPVINLLQKEQRKRSLQLFLESEAAFPEYWLKAAIRWQKERRTAKGSISIAVLWPGIQGSIV
jgi:hypothetical protein